MTRPVFVAELELLAEASPGVIVRLDGKEGHHAARVMRLAPGQWVDLVDGAGRRATGTVSRVSGDRVEVEMVEITDEPAPTPRLVLVQALAKGDRDLAAVETATEYGIDEIVPWQAEHCVVRWKGERGERSLRKWTDLTIAAAKQSRRSRVPDVLPPVALGELTARVAAASGAFVLHEGAVTPLATTQLPDRGDVLLIVGPEGGISPNELAALTGAGAVAVRLGHEVLRTSSAGPAAIAVLSSRSRWR